MRSRTLPVALLAAAVLPLALTACSSGTSAPPASSGAAQSAGAPSSPNPDAGLLTGTQLESALAPASFFPAGYSVDAPNSVNTGATFQPQTIASASAAAAAASASGAAAASASAAATPDCTKLDGTAWIGITGLSGVSFAQDDYLDKAAQAEQAQEIDEFQTGGAQTALAALGRIATVCPTFTDALTKSKVKVVEKAKSGLGDGAYVITLTDPSWLNGQTLEAVRVGSAVITVLSTAGTDDGASSAARLSAAIVTALNNLSASAGGTQSP